MKRILNNIGAVSKQAIIGGAITVATLVVGIGLMNNFSSKDSMEQGFASNAIERSGYSYNSAYEGASAEDILSARGSIQNSDGKSAIIGTENLAFNRRNSTANAGGAGQGSAASGDIALVQDGTQGYSDGEIEGMGTSNNITVDVAKENEAALKAKRDAKIAQGEALTKQAKATLKTSKMADSSGIAGIATGSTSMAYGSLNGANGASDSSKIALAQAGKLSNVNLQGANSGNLSAMGSKNVEASGERLGRTSLGQHVEAIGDLKRASKYSKSGKNAVSGDIEKGAADASAAFDGSREADAVNLEGENLQQAALSNLEDPDLDTSAVTDPLKDMQAQIDKYNDIAGKANKQFLILLAVASGIALASSILVSTVPYPWNYVAGAAVIAAGLITVAGLLWGLQESYASLYNQALDLSVNNGGLTPGKGEWWAPGELYGFFAAMMATGLAGAWGLMASSFLAGIVQMKAPSKM